MWGGVLYTRGTFPQFVAVLLAIATRAVSSAEAFRLVSRFPVFSVVLGRDVMWVAARRAGVVPGGFAPGSFNGQDSDIAGTHAQFCPHMAGIFWLSATLSVQLYIVAHE